MRKVLKWIGIVLGSLLGLLVLVIVGLLIYGQISFKPVQANRPVYQIQADVSPEGLARGKYLVENVMGCAGACHSPSPETPFIGVMDKVNMGPAELEFNTPNLTPDQQTGLGSWTDAEIARAIREGVDREGRALVVMPSYNYHVLSDADMAAILGYLRSLPPARNEIKPLGANAFGKMILIPNILIPASMGTPISSAQATPASATADYGAYLVSIAGCRDCHKPNLAGGAPPDGGLPVPNLTPGGDLGQWSEADFLTAMHTGMRPDGRRLSPDMPYESYGKMTDEDLRTIFTYLRSLATIAAK